MISMLDLKLTIEKLKSQTRALDEIIIVNNASTDGTREYLPPSLVKAIATGELPDITDKGGQIITNVTDPTYPLDDKTFDEADKIIVYYMHDKIDSIYDIDFEELDEFTYFLPTWTNMVKILLLL